MSTPEVRAAIEDIRSLTGISEEELSQIPITYVDGLNDAWPNPPAFVAHL